MGDVREIRLLTSIGLGIHKVAKHLGISHDVLERWKKEFREIEDAIADGRNSRQKRAYACFFNQAFPVDQEGRPTSKGDNSLMIFWMKTREGWKQADAQFTVGTEDGAPTIQFCIKKQKRKLQKEFEKEPPPEESDEADTD
jgi:hypothetical protein